MAIYTITIKTHAFNNIKDGTKKIEVRLYRSIFTKIKIGDIIIFHDKINDEKLSMIVKDLDTYDSFEELFSNHSIDIIVPNKNNIEEAILHYNSIYKNTKNKKILAIHL